MKRFISILLLIVNASFVFGQLTFLPNDISKAKKDLPPKIKTIRQFKENFLLNVREYDTLKNLTFSHYKQYVGENWNGKYLTMITGNLYDQSGKVVKSFHLHSNSGLRIWYFEYDPTGNNTRIYMRTNNFEDDPSLINKNPYNYISEITSISELINHPKMTEIEAVAYKYLESEQTFDSYGNLLTEVNYEVNSDTSSYRRFEYNENQQEIYFYNEWSNKVHWEYYYEYEDNIAFYFDDSIAESKPGKRTQSVRVDYDSRDNRKRISDITFFKYDYLGRLIEEVSYDKGIFESKDLYEYNEINQLENRISYVHNPDRIAATKSYSYNNEGNVIKMVDQDFRSGEKKVEEYRYEYEYYK